MEAINRIPESNNMQDYLRRLSDRRLSGGSGGSTDGGSPTAGGGPTGGDGLAAGSTGAPIGRIAGDGNGLNNSGESSVPLGTSVANTASSA
jgi:hypothetical protein